MHLVHFCLFFISFYFILIFPNFYEVRLYFCVLITSVLWKWISFSPPHTVPWFTSQSALEVCKLHFFQIKPNCKTCLRNRSSTFQLLKGVQSMGLDLVSPCDTHNEGIGIFFFVIYMPTLATLHYCSADRVQHPPGNACSHLSSCFTNLAQCHHSHFAHAGSAAGTVHLWLIFLQVLANLSYVMAGQALRETYGMNHPTWGV